MLLAVRQDDRDRVALLQAERAQALGRSLDLVAEFGIGGRLAEEFERDIIGVLLDRELDQVGE